MENINKMGRPVKSLQSRVNEYKKYGLVASKTSNKLFCKYCGDEVAFERKSTIDNHIKSSSHVRNSGNYYL